MISPSIHSNFVTQQLLPELLAQGVFASMNVAMQQRIVQLDYLNRTLPMMIVAPQHWLLTTQICKNFKCRFAGMWGEEGDADEDAEGGAFAVTSCFYIAKQYFLLRTYLDDTDNPRLASQANIYYAANRFERHCRDLLGIDFIDSFDMRRWTRHQAWGEHEFPLRRGVVPTTMLTATVTSSDSSYPCLSGTSSDLYQIPVGPVHAGIIEPGHFRFHAAGEDIIHLEERFGYLHRGIEKIATTRTPATLLSLASRVSGDSAVAHSWAAAMALENALHLKIPPRANLIRAILCERERVANHLWDVAAICNDVAFTFGYYQLGRLYELWMRTNAAVFQHRLLMDVIVLGGVKMDLSPAQVTSMLQEFKVLESELKELQPIIENNSSLKNRLHTTGILSSAMAGELGVLGFVAKASSVDFDVRRDFSYPPYDELNIRIPVFTNGDVEARLMVRWQEIFYSLQLLSELLQLLIDFAAEIDKEVMLSAAVFSLPHQTSSAGIGIGIVEGWRGEIITYAKIDNKNNIARFFPRDPSWFNWLALEKLLYRDIVPDFPVCNKSINGSYAGCDL